jgi:pimeloyl-ACP methyl ester carboxylesterase
VPSKKPKPAEPGSRGYSATAKIALQEGATRVQEIHGAIANTTFNVLRKIPAVSGTAAVVESLHNAISAGVYAAIHHGGGALLDAAEAIEQRVKPDATSASPPSRLANNLRSAINGAFGDHLAETGSVLAIPMALYNAGHPVALTRAELGHAWPQHGERLCLFIHGLGGNEQCWQADVKVDCAAIDIPRCLAAETDYTCLELRYNTGLPIDDNGHQLSALLEELLAAWPQPVAELLIIGHSMGGLLVRSAFAQGIAAGCAWPQALAKVICLGTPHLGSPVERLGQFTTAALSLSPITAPLARFAAKRSQGIQDLRHGPGRHECTSHVAWRFIGGSLSDDPESALSKLVGDGLVTPASATAHEATGDSRSLRLGGVGHMRLLNDPRVYGQILAWLQDDDGPD